MKIIPSSKYLLYIVLFSVISEQAMMPEKKPERTIKSSALAEREIPSKQDLQEQSDELFLALHSTPVSDTDRIKALLNDIKKLLSNLKLVDRELFKKTKEKYSEYKQIIALKMQVLIDELFLKLTTSAQGEKVSSSIKKIIKQLDDLMSTLSPLDPELHTKLRKKYFTYKKEIALNIGQSIDTLLLQLTKSVQNKSINGDLKKIIEQLDDLLSALSPLYPELYFHYESAYTNSRDEIANTIDQEINNLFSLADDYSFKINKEISTPNTAVNSDILEDIKSLHNKMNALEHLNLSLYFNNGENYKHYRITIAAPITQKIDALMKQMTKKNKNDIDQQIKNLLSLLNIIDKDILREKEFRYKQFLKTMSYK